MLNPDVLGLVLKEHIDKDARVVCRAFRDAWNGSVEEVCMIAATRTYEVAARLKACRRLTVRTDPVKTPCVHLASILTPTQQQRLEELRVVVEVDPFEPPSIQLDARIAALGPMARLRKLDLTANEFLNIDSMLSACPRLEELRLSGQPHTVPYVGDAAPIAVTVPFPASLRVLDLNLVRFASPPSSRDCLLGCTELRELRLAHIASTPLLPCGPRLEVLALCRLDLDVHRLERLKTARLRVLDLDHVEPMWLGMFGGSRATLHTLWFYTAGEKSDEHCISAFVAGRMHIKHLEVPELASTTCLCLCASSLEYLGVDIFDDDNDDSWQPPLQFTSLRALWAPTNLVAALLAGRTADVAMPALEDLQLGDRNPWHRGRAEPREVLRTMRPERLRKLALYVSDDCTQSLKQMLCDIDLRSLEHLEVHIRSDGVEEVCALPQLRHLEVSAAMAHRIVVRSCPMLASIELTAGLSLKELHVELMHTSVVEVTSRISSKCIKKLAVLRLDEGQKTWAIEDPGLTIVSI